MEKKRLNLALQGGGAHGAFTWGVLDRLLQEPWLTIEGISGTSAGAANAVVLADGLVGGGADGGRRALDAFWRAVSRAGRLNPYRSGWWNPFGLNFSPLVAGVEWLAGHFSPYQLNPRNLNVLVRLLDAQVDFARLRSSVAPKLFVSATNVRTNRLHIFTNARLSARVIGASACLPQLFQAVEIDGESYWDGGFMGNPVLEPLVKRCEARDILIVQINPKHRERVPRTVNAIADRVNEITFNATLMREIRAIARMTDLLDELGVEGHEHERAWLHLIDAEEVLAPLDLRSKYDTSWRFLTTLRDRGRERADQWLSQNSERIGVGDTVDLSSWAPPYD
jgi:NTE family protein